eukprot:jgi/Psemu1/11581/gm1.11581_g
MEQEALKTRSILAALLTPPPDTNTIDRDALINTIKIEFDNESPNTQTDRADPRYLDSPINPLNLTMTSDQTPSQSYKLNGISLKIAAKALTDTDKMDLLKRIEAKQQQPFHSITISKNASYWKRIDTISSSMTSKMCSLSLCQKIKAFDETPGNLNYGKLKVDNQDDPIIYDLFWNYLQLPPGQVSASSRFYLEFVEDDHLMHKNLAWSFIYYKKNVQKELYNTVHSNWMEYSPSEQGGPLLLKLLLDEVSMTGKASLTSLIHILDTFQAIFNTIRELRPRSDLPDESMRKLLTVFWTTSIDDFNQQFTMMEDQRKSQVLLNNMQFIKYVLDYAKAAYRDLTTDGKRDQVLQPPPGKSDFVTGTKAQPSGEDGRVNDHMIIPWTLGGCFNCGSKEHIFKGCPIKCNQAWICINMASYPNGSKQWQEQEHGKHIIDGKPYTWDKNTPGFNDRWIMDDCPADGHPNHGRPPNQPAVLANLGQLPRTTIIPIIANLGQLPSPSPSTGIVCAVPTVTGTMTFLLDEKADPAVQKLQLYSIIQKCKECTGCQSSNPTTKRDDAGSSQGDIIGDTTNRGVICCQREPSDLSGTPKTPMSSQTPAESLLPHIDPLKHYQAIEAALLSFTLPHQYASVEGKVAWGMKNCNGVRESITTMAYFVPEAIQLLRPSFQDSNNLPIILTDKALHPTQSHSIIMDKQCHDNILDNHSNFAYLGTMGLPNSIKTTNTVLQQSIWNLTPPQQELLLWHNRLGHMNLGHQIFQSSNNKSLHCSPCVCEACQYEKQKWVSPPSCTTSARPENEGKSSSIEIVHPGQQVSVDLYQSETKGRVPGSFGKERVGAHHQNRAERSIQTVFNTAQALLLHFTIHRPQQAATNLWLFALFTGTQFYNHNHLQRLHAFGSPVYVFNPTLQDGKKIPNWEHPSQQGIYLEQYHAMVDDTFSTVYSSATPENWGIQMSYDDDDDNNKDDDDDDDDNPSVFPLIKGRMRLHMYKYYHI